MAWNSTKIDDVHIISAQSWNDQVDFIESISSQTWWISGNYAGHSSNADIHLPSSQFRSWLDSIYSPTGATGVGYWSSQTEGVYYEGQVVIAPSGTDYGTYNLQVSGDTFLSGNVIFKGSTFSGLADPTYNSGAANKHYVDIISGAITSWAQGQFYPSSNLNSGYIQISSLTQIAHGLSSIPSYVNITPSGNSINFGVSCKVDATNITVDLTATGKRDVYWTAQI